MGCAASGDVQVAAQDSFHSKYRLGHKIGQGAFGQVREARCEDGKQELAVKVVCFKDAKRREAALAEAQVWGKAGQHPHIVELLGAFVELEFAFLVMERCGKDINSCISGLWKDELRCARIFRCVALALEHLHTLQIAHRDVKPANILLSDDGAKLCDFGVATVVPRRGLLCTAGTAPFMAPEVVRGQPYFTSVDLWSLGACLYVALFGELPYKPEDGCRGGAAYKAAVIRGSPPSFVRTDGHAPASSAVCLSRELLTRTVLKRPTAAQALTLPFLAAVDTPCDSHGSFSTIDTASMTSESTNEAFI